jgi:hypothetical protein
MLRSLSITVRSACVAARFPEDRSRRSGDRFQFFEKIRRFARDDSFPVFLGMSQFASFGWIGYCHRLNFTNFGADIEPEQDRVNYKFQKDRLRGAASQRLSGLFFCHHACHDGRQY